MKKSSRGLALGRWVLLCVSCLVVAVGLMGAKAAKKKEAEKEMAPSEKPWVLRDHYTFKTEDKELIFAVDTGEWTIRTADGATFLEKVSFSITLEDGSVLTPADFSIGASTRTNVTQPLDDVTEYYVDLPGKKGVSVRSTLIVPKTRPFYMLKVAVRNDGTTPVGIKSISPIVFGPASVIGGPTAIELGLRRVTARGRFTVFDTKSLPQAALFHYREKNTTIALSILAQGKARSGMTFTPESPNFQGEVVCAYEPGVTLAPKESLETDVIWLSFAVADPAEVDANLAWTHSVHFGAQTLDAPELLVSLPASSPAEELYAAARSWAGSGAKHVLVPSGWEGHPGVLEGGGPGYPKNMRDVAKAIRGLQMKPGLTVDPLAVANENPQWSVKSDDGQSWLNISIPEAKQFAVAKLKEAANWGFDFFSIAPSSIPDSVLKTFKMTRQQADTLAIEMMTTAAEGKPVLPSSATILGPNAEAWREAAADLSRVSEYRLAVGPVVLDASAAGPFTDDVLAAIALFSGPIELRGKPEPKLLKQMAQLFPRNARRAKPIDVARISPIMWEMPLGSIDDQHYASSLVLFPGAAPGTIGEIHLPSTNPVTAWTLEDGAIMPNGSLPPAQQMTVYGLVANAERPVFMGARGRLGFLYNNLGGITWNEKALTLSGIIGSSASGLDRGYIYVPDSWILDKGAFGDKTLRKKDATTVIAFDLNASGDTRFEFSFERK